MTRILRNFAKFTGKHLCQSLFFNKVTGLRPEVCNFIKKETLAQMFSSEFCEFSKNTSFTEHLRASASEIYDADKLFLNDWFTNEGVLILFPVGPFPGDSHHWNLTFLLIVKIYRSSRPEVFCKKSVLKYFAEFNLNFSKFLRTSIFIDHLRWLLLNLIKLSESASFRVSIIIIIKYYWSKG